jgi:hypothetical protein
MQRYRRDLDELRLPTTASTGYYPYGAEIMATSGNGRSGSGAYGADLGEPLWFTEGGGFRDGPRLLRGSLLQRCAGAVLRHHSAVEERSPRRLWFCRQASGNYLESVPILIVPST